MTNFYKSKKDFGENDFKNLESGLIHESEMIVGEDMLYFTLFKSQNDKGSCLRISSREGRQRGLKWKKIFVPADGMEEFKRSLKELVEEYGEISSAEQGIGTKTN